jgi:predicted nucleic acid-binding protein
MYFDTTYIAKFYLNEPDSRQVRALATSVTFPIRTSMWAFAEFHSVLRRHTREDRCSPEHAREFASRFSEQINRGVWEMLPLTESLLRRTSALLFAMPENLFIRTGDAVHLVSAFDAGEFEVWTNDRHMLAAAPHFGLTGRHV